MAFPATRVSKNILHCALQENVDVSLMKLQKILFFLTAEYGKAFPDTPNHEDRYLLNQQFQPWKFGPVLPSVYDEFKIFGSAPIKKYAKDADGRSTIIDESQNPVFKNVLDRVWLATRNIDAIRLSEISQAQGSAWWNSWMKYERYISEDAIIADNTYKSALAL